MRMQYKSGRQSPVEQLNTPLSKVTLTGFRALSVLFLSIALTACGTKYAGTNRSGTLPSAQPPIPTSPAPDNTETTAPTTVSSEIRPTSVPDQNTPRSLPAAIALREQAIQAASQQNHIRAIGLLERAIRISPDDPETFRALAESHLAERRPQQALELTRRALALNPSPNQQITLAQLEQRCLAGL